jgi:pyruvate dehydrogenase phosphatase
MTARPEVCKYILDDDVKFLILASDGLFDVFTNADIVREVGLYLNNLDPKNDSNVGTHLIRLAVGAGRGPKHLARMLSLSPRISRSYRDDITIQVVLFNNLKQPLSEVTSVELERYKP